MSAPSNARDAGQARRFSPVANIEIHRNSKSVATNAVLSVAISFSPPAALPFPEQAARVGVVQELAVRLVGSRRGAADEELVGEAERPMLTGIPKPALTMLNLSAPGAKATIVSPPSLGAL
jgi:hypothetical protein